jgi:hypothetical protein
MKTHRILVIATLLLAVPALASAASLTPQPAAAGVSQAALAAVPTLDAFLSSLKNPGTAPGTKAASSCGSNFCTQAQRDACNQQCLAHHHGTFVGLECCSDCTTLCICGSVPVGC